VILMHVREVTLPTNTARLATASLANSELRLRGALDQAMPTDGLVVPDRQSLFLYPSDEARELGPALLDGRPVTLIVPDGSWRQARKVAAREPALAGIPQVRLPPGPPSRYRLRKEPNEHALSTFEAIARALGVLEGSEVRKALEDLFDLRVERTLWSRGLLKAEECRFGIPPEAYEAFYRDGCRGGENAKKLLEAARAAAKPLS
jgi:DTW domain-containing protein YfiP